MLAPLWRAGIREDAVHGHVMEASDQSVMEVSWKRHGSVMLWRARAGEDAVRAQQLLARDYGLVAALAEVGRPAHAVGEALSRRERRR